jgi:hypothetical protein
MGPLGRHILVIFHVPTIGSMPGKIEYIIWHPARTRSAARHRSVKALFIQTSSMMFLQWCIYNVKRGYHAVIRGATEKSPLEI